MQKEGDVGTPSVTVNQLNDVVPVLDTSSFSRAMLGLCRRMTFETVREGPPADAEMAPDIVA
jgi:hypothetical protein